MILENIRLSKKFLTQQKQILVVFAAKRKNIKTFNKIDIRSREFKSRGGMKNIGVDFDHSKPASITSLKFPLPS